MQNHFDHLRVSFRDFDGDLNKQQNQFIFLPVTKKNPNTYAFSFSVRI